MSLLNNYIDRWLSPPDDPVYDLEDLENCEVCDRQDHREEFRTFQKRILCENCYLIESTEKDENEI